MDTLKTKIIETVLKLDDKVCLYKIQDYIKYLPNKNQSIQPIQIKSGVSLAEISKGQKVEKTSFEVIQNMFKDEVWEQTLEDLLSDIN